MELDLHGTGQCPVRVLQSVTWNADADITLVKTFLFFGGFF